MSDEEKTSLTSNETQRIVDSEGLAKGAVKHLEGWIKIVDDIPVDRFFASEKEAKESGPATGNVAIVHVMELYEY